MSNNASNAKYLGNIIIGISVPGQPATGYTEKEENCKGCMGPCGQCDKDQEPDADELPDEAWEAANDVTL